MLSLRFVAIALAASVVVCLVTPVPTAAQVGPPNPDGTCNPLPAPNNTVPPVEIDVPFDPLAACGSPLDSQTFAHCVVSKVVGPPIVLPHPWVHDPDAQAIYEEFCNAIEKTVAVLENTAAGDPILLETLAFVKSVSSVVLSVRQQIENAHTTNDCRQLQSVSDADECPTSCDALVAGQAVPVAHVQAAGETLEVVPAQGDAGALPGFYASSLLPLPPFANYSNRAPHETVVAGSVERGGAYLVLKEAFGLKLRLWYTWIPIWVEPWYSRRRIVGRKLVWHLRWVPCEYIKTIAYNSFLQGGALGAPVMNAVEFCDSRLLSYWRWFPRAIKPLR